MSCAGPRRSRNLSHATGSSYVTHWLQRRRETLESTKHASNAVDLVEHAPPSLPTETAGGVDKRDVAPPSISLDWSTAASNRLGVDLDRLVLSAQIRVVNVVRLPHHRTIRQGHRDLWCCLPSPPDGVVAAGGQDHHATRVAVEWARRRRLGYAV